MLHGLPEDTHPCLLVQCAYEVQDVDRLLDLAPRSARYNVATGSHTEAVQDFRVLSAHLDRIAPADLGPWLEEWASEESLVDSIDEAIRLIAVARAHYRPVGDQRAESRTLQLGSAVLRARWAAGTGGRHRRSAISVLGPEPMGSDLARALEANAYLQTMAGNVAAVLDLVDRTLGAGGPDIDERVLLRSLNHRGNAANVAGYPDGRASLDEARERAEAAGDWWEHTRALLNHAWAAAEAQDVPIASDYAQRAIASAIRHELSMVGGLPARRSYAGSLELMGRWDEAADLARDVLDGRPSAVVVARPDPRGARRSEGPSRRSTPSSADLWQMASAGE